MPVQIRKTLLQIETTLIEGGKAAPQPLKLFSAVAVVKIRGLGTASSRI